MLEETVKPRKPVQYREGTIKAKDARICWDADSQKIIVTTMGREESLQSKRLPMSGGACYAKWRENCQNEKDAMIILLKQYFTFTYIWRFNPEVVDQAFSEIIEWNDAWVKVELRSGEEGY